MKRLLSLITLCLTLCLAPCQAYTVDNLPVKTQYADSLDFTAVCNPDSLISPAQEDSLNQILWTLRERNGVQGLVICVKQIDPEDGYEFAIEVGRKYGVGGKQNLGFVIVVAKESRDYYVLTGDGMEKFLTDAQCSIIGRKTMVPLLKQGQWGEAVLQATMMIDGICNGEIELNPDDFDDDDDDGDLGGALLVLLAPVAGVGGLGYYLNRKSKKCPKCGKQGWHRTRRNIVLPEMVPDEMKADSELSRLVSNLMAYDEFAGGIPLGIATNAAGEQVEKTGTKVQIFDDYCCSECQHRVVRTMLGSSEANRLGGFDGTGPLLWGAIALAAASGRRFRGGGFRGGFGGGSGPTMHSTFGGGHFSGGGAGGKF